MDVCWYGGKCVESVYARRRGAIDKFQLKFISLIQVARPYSGLRVLFRVFHRKNHSYLSIFRRCFWMLLLWFLPEMAEMCAERV